MAEDFNKLRLIAKKLVRTTFQRQWQFRLDIDGAPSDLDFYVKDVSYTAREISTDEEQCGATVLTWPKGITPVRISVTMRDNMDERIRKWVIEWMDTIVYPDGTVGLPSDYVRTARKYIVAEDSSETLSDTWQVFPVSIGDISQSRDSDDFLEFPITFVQSKSE